MPRKTSLLWAILACVALAWPVAIGQDAPPPTPKADAPTSRTIAPDLTLLQQFNQTADRIEGAFRSIRASQWILAFLAVLVGLVLQKVAIFLLQSRLMKLAARTKSDVDDVLFHAIARPVSYFPLTLGLIAAGLVLGFRTGAGDAKTWFGNTVITLIVFNAAWVLYNLVDVVTHMLRKVTARTETNLDDQLVPLVSKALRVLVVLLAITTLGSWVGGPFKGILAGLGLGGLAFALAAKDTISNLFGYAVIFMDRPFFIGDVVQINGFMGVVEELGARSVRIRTFDKTLVVMPNMEVANATVENISARPARRVYTSVGVTYETTAEQMEDLVEGIRAILAGHEKIEQDSFVVSFESFGGSSLDIRVVFFILELGYPEYLAVLQEINLAFMRLVDEKGLSIAFPTHTVYLRQDPDGVPVLGAPNATQD